MMIAFRNTIIQNDLYNPVVAKILIKAAVAYRLLKKITPYLLKEKPPENKSLKIIIFRNVKKQLPLN